MRGNHRNFIVHWSAELFFVKENTMIKNIVEVMISICKWIFGITLFIRSVQTSFSKSRKYELFFFSLSEYDSHPLHFEQCSTLCRKVFWLKGVAQTWMFHVGWKLANISCSTYPKINEMIKRNLSWLKINWLIGMFHLI